MSKIFKESEILCVNVKNDICKKTNVTNHHKPHDIIENVLYEILVKEAICKVGTITNKAMDEAHIIIRQAQQDSENIFANARAAGYQQGYVEGVDKAKQEYDRLLIDLENCLEEANEYRSSVINDLETEIVDLIFHIAEKILLIGLERNNSLFLNIVKNAIRRVSAHREIVLKVSPFEYELVNKLKGSLMNSVPDLKHLEIIQDELLEKGACIVTSTGGTVDAGMHTQLMQAKNVFNTLAGENV